MPDCKSCKEKRAMTAKVPETIPYLAYQASQARNERTVKRLVIALIVAILMIFASNAVWLYAWCQYDYSSEDTIYQQDGKGTNIIGNSNEVDNVAETNNPQTDTQEEKW